ncbi:MAG: phosphoribosylformylglycinamidine synthase subunit PurQ [Desulfobacterales bacterium]|jgi:phosphoribosylformylglycinamidine synthase|nr:phosphoribosylformylglycinamidine synthase subunit PurQ [Desulfobacterales bacterium]
MATVNVLIPTGYGLNCDHETAHAFALAGAAARRVHINALIDGDVRLEEHQILVFIGGFGWGDDHGAGVIQAVKMKTSLGERLLEFVSRGKLVLGICNGFQALVNLGLLPGFDGDYHSRSIALLGNACGNFRNQWVRLQVNPRSPCVFTRGIFAADLPVRHGEGRLCAEETLIRRLDRQGQIVLRYALPDGSRASGRFPHNPNGSVDDIAGICDPTGRIFGLMPHPEAFNDWTNHPDWTRERERLRRAGRPFEAGETVGVRMLRNAVDYMRAA